MQNSQVHYAIYIQYMLMYCCHEIPLALLVQFSGLAQFGSHRPYRVVYDWFHSLGQIGLCNFCLYILSYAKSVKRARH